MLNRSMPRVDVSRFSMVPRADVPRSTFRTQSAHKTTFDTGYLVPLYIDEVLPGDFHRGRITVFARLATPVFPIMDDIELETFFFYIPNRLLWKHWVKMMGERVNPDDSISFTTPQLVSPAGGWAVGSIFDYFGLPTVGQMGGGATKSVNVLPLRAYNLVFDEWFRDQNLQDTNFVKGSHDGDGPDSNAQFALKRRNKKHDYFTSALPWPLKGGVEVMLPIAGQAPVHGIGIGSTADPTNGNPGGMVGYGGEAISGWTGYYATSSNELVFRAPGTAAGSGLHIYADLETGTGATINALRLAFQTQRLLERDARGGTRYTEILQSHFGVTPQDQRLQRPEYIGGGRTHIQTSAIAQTSKTDGTNVLGQLGAAATAADQHHFHCNATEHGWILGLVHVTGAITYNQGLHRMWTRLTRYDHYWPAFAFLGEQAVRNDEIYVQGTAADDDVWGYQERWAEYRHMPSRISGLFRTTSAGNIDEWHLAQHFASLPALNDDFIQDTPPTVRVLAAGSAANGMQVLLDSVASVDKTRPLPMFSVPGMIDRF